MPTVSIGDLFSERIPPGGEIVRAADAAYRELPKLGTIDTVSYGPRDGEDVAQPAERFSTTGTALKRASSDPHFGRVLYKVAFHAARRAGGDATVVELGTCVGISGMYILAGLASAGGGKLITFEGSQDFARIAGDHFDALINRFQLNNVSYETVAGPFAETIPSALNRLSGTALVFIDGNHLEGPTLEYHHSFRERMIEGGIIVHDDIGWSPGMSRAWDTIVEEEGTGCCVELHRGFTRAKGMVLLSDPREGPLRQVHVDNPVSRPFRALTRILRRR